LLKLEISVLMLFGTHSKLLKLKIQKEIEHKLPSECATPSFMR